VEISLRDNQFQARRRRSQSGQAVTEYILVLVVVIALIVGVVYQFNDAVKIWANNYFGNYLSCLLETGELPTLGGDGGLSSSCKDSYQEFSLANGRPPKDAGAGPGSGDSDSRKNSSNGAASGSSGGGATDGGGSDSSRFKVSSGFDQRFGAKGSGGAGGNGTTGEKKSGGDSLEPTTQGGFQGYGGIGGPQRAGNENTFPAGKRSKRKENEAKAPVIAKTGGGSAARVPRMLVRKPAAAAPTIEEEPMTFGDYFRYLIIIALILALVIVIGGQVVQVSKELE
jgi:hypothetical protein